MATVLYMSISLDGFVAGPHAGPENGLGDGGLRLHEWWPWEPGGNAVNERVAAGLMATGAVVAGRSTFEPARGWDGDHHDGVPIFIVSRRPPEEQIGQWPLVTYVADVATAMADARRAAGKKDVLVHGATLARLALEAGVLDEIQLHVVPCLLGDGQRLFGDHGPEPGELERIAVLEGEAGITHLRYHVRR